jgi:uncharacterized membrane protein YkoI
VPGRVVEAELARKHGTTVWEIEVLGTDGNITKVRIDADSGAVIATKGK